MGLGVILVLFLGLVCLFIYLDEYSREKDFSSVQPGKLFRNKVRHDANPFLTSEFFVEVLEVKGEYVKFRNTKEEIAYTCHIPKFLEMYIEKE